MNMFADITLEPGGLIAWLVVGLIAGWLAGQVMKGGGYGLIGDIVVGLIGALVGGFLFGLIVTTAEGFWGSILIAFLGACVAIAVFRFVSRERTPL
jgi:uncharacterized membrane protein YeaQ/YmgE (transglycosylase-associated protein family)